MRWREEQKLTGISQPLATRHMDGRDDNSQQRCSTLLGGAALNAKCLVWSRPPDRETLERGDERDDPHDSDLV